MRRNTVSEMTIERTPCLGACPVYKIQIKNDTSVIYIGKIYVEKIGVYRGNIANWQFDFLVEMLEKLGFYSLKDRYARMVTDGPETIISVVRNGKRKIVSRQGDPGPSSLMALEILIDTVGNTFPDKWEKIRS